jgi:cell division protease FtsH
LGVLPWVLIIGLWIFMRRAQQQMQAARAVFSAWYKQSKTFVKAGENVQDVAGMDNVKNELRETIEFLKNPSVLVSGQRCRVCFW